ncbi:MAG: AraC family transcriptional regulator [Clostridia bacterium]|jgi:AraC family transcriptional regulator|nr:AraC family transcriptional regulator [Clostridia bacterium]
MSIKQSIDYIEEHLTDEITLDSLAELSFFSKYHFHRLFKTETGKAPMEYVRERRLTQAAYELAFSSKSITYIAHSLSFNSQDAFDKAFKRVYGITPIEYRKSINQKLSKLTFKEDYNMNYLSADISCCVAEKQECLKLMDVIISLSKKAHMRGLLSLESEISDRFPFLLRKGIDLMLYGMEPLVLQEVLDTYISAGNYSGKELLSRLLIRNGILSIQMGEYPWVIREKLSSYFGEEFSDEVSKYFGCDPQSLENKLSEFVSRIQNLKPYSEATSLLESIFEKLDSRSIQRCLREIDIMKLAIGMKGASGKTQNIILEGLSRQSLSILIELSELIQDIQIPQIVDAQNNIVGYIKRLRAEGEIK